MLGTVEVDHPKRHAYGAKDLVALSTLANQIATAIHIAELRRPLLSTVEPDQRAGDGAGPGDRVAARLGRSRWPRRRTACGRARPSWRRFVAGGLRATDALSARVAAPWRSRARRRRQASGTAAEVAGRNRVVIGEAIDRLVGLKGFVAGERRPGGDAGRR